MKRLEMKKAWNDVKGKLKNLFADLAEDDMLFSQVKENELIRDLQQRLERLGMKLYNHQSI